MVCVNLPDTQWVVGDDCREVKQQSGTNQRKARDYV